MPFSSTLQALMADSLRRSYVGLAAVAVVLSAWLVWFVFAEVGIYQTAPARLQTERDIHAVEASIEGRVLAIHMAVGREVRAGDILVVLDDTAVHLKLAEHRARLDAAREQLRANETGIAAGQLALTKVREAAPMVLAETRLRYEQAQGSTQLAQEELVRWRASGAASELQMLERETTAQRRRSETEALRLAMTRQGLDLSASEADRLASIERLRRDAAELKGLISTTLAAIRQGENEAQDYLLRAPASGPLAEVADLRPGMMLRSGEKIATIVPSGELKVLADFPPRAVGHIRPGQPAWLRLDGFPWGQYGRVRATVVRVAKEPRVGKIRVELSVPPRHTAIPLQHGLPGSVEIEVERASPAVLVLRAAGGLLRSAAAETGQ